MMIDGAILIGGEAIRTDATFAAAAAAGGDVPGSAFSESDTGHVERACRLASGAFDSFRDISPHARATFLDTVADRVGALGDALIERAMAETGLPRARLTGELGRTTGQLRLFAETLRRGDWLGVRIDPARPERTPLPRPDLRLRNIAIGPIAVFGASNFPLAFSVAGGDTASALAAGCPVVVKGHPAHPGTGEMVARAVLQAVADCGLPPGVFAFLPGSSRALGAALVADPNIQAVGFTGSRSGGLALMAVAAARPQPIPVFAEMSSVNPVLLFPAALAERAEAIATGFVASLTMGAGQFCTNPGLVLAIGDDTGIDRFLAAAATALADTPGAPAMLTRGIAASFVAGIEELTANPALSLVARGQADAASDAAAAALFVTDSAAFLADRCLSREVFGASSIVVRCATVANARAVLDHLEGQLTITLHHAEADLDAAADLVPLLERRAGRILANGWPTGVEVGHAMVHGGPFPATSDARSTSVGSRAIERFLRPVSYQDLPARLLPTAVSDANVWNLPRAIDGQFGSSG